MKLHTLLLILAASAMAIAIASAAEGPAAQTIPKYTVIPVILDDTISTARNKTGDKFEVHCTGSNCGGFPSGTTFVGILTITPAQGEKPAQGSAKFVSAILPDERKIEILAVPSTAEGVKVDGKTGETTKKKSKKKGARIGGVIGTLAAGFPGAVAGRVVGGAAGSKKAKGLDIELKAGLKGYIMLTEPATIPPLPQRKGKD